MQNWQGECGPEVVWHSWATALRGLQIANQCCVRTLCSHDYMQDSATTMFMTFKAAGINAVANRKHTVSGWWVGQCMGWLVVLMPMHNAEDVCAQKWGLAQARPNFYYYYYYYYFITIVIPKQKPAAPPLLGLISVAYQWMWWDDCFCIHHHCKHLWFQQKQIWWLQSMAWCSVEQTIDKYHSFLPVISHQSIPRSMTLTNLLFNLAHLFPETTCMVQGHSSISRL